MPPRRSARSKSPAKAAKDADCDGAAADATATKRTTGRAARAADEGARAAKAARRRRAGAAARAGGAREGGAARGLTTRAIEDDALFATARETWRRSDGEAAYDGAVVRKIYEEELGGGRSGGGDGAIAGFGRDGVRGTVSRRRRARSRELRSSARDVGDFRGE